MTSQRRLGFRMRLTLVIAGVFIAAGAALLAVQYLVVQQLFADALDATADSCLNITAVDATQSDVNLDPAIPNSEQTTFVTGCSTLSLVTAEEATTLVTGVVGVSAVSATGAVLQQSQFLSNEVIGGLLLWSIVTLVVFAAIAAALAFWLARRSLDRIGEVTATARDISERHLDRRLDLPGPEDEIKELGDTIDTMLDRLQLAFAAQDRFVANASHELRTPLTTTRVALEIPLEQGQVPASLEPAVRTALRATRQSERLIASLLSLSRGRVAAEEFETVDLGNVVQDQIDELRPSAAARHVGVHTAINGGLVSGDVTLLARAVRNLLDNGIRHNVDGGDLWVRVTGRTVDVESTGEHVDATTIALLTEPFYRGTASRTSSGENIGLGLAIVESIALTHGGSLTLARREDGGLIARLALPTA